MRKLKLFFACLLMAVLSIGQVWGDSYTITLKNGTGSGDSSSGIQSSTSISDFVADGASYVSAVAGSGKVFQGASGYGLKFGNSNGGGSVTLTLATAVKPTSIVVSASQYNNTEGTGVFQGTNYDMTGGGGKGNFNNYTVEYDGNTEVTTISVGCTKRGYVKSITVNYGTTPSPSCTSEITITKADDPANGTFALDNSGTVCIDEGNATVNVTATPADHYHLASVTTTGSVGTIGSIAGNTCEITDIDADTEIGVTFAEDTKYVVTWNVNGNEDTKTNVYAGEKPVFPATPAACDATSTTFIGWATAPWTGKLDDLSEKTVYTSASDMPAVNAAVTYYAVFAKVSGTPSVTHTLTISGKTAASGYASRSETDDKDATWSGVYNYGDETHIGLNKKSDNHYLGSPLFDANVTSVKATIKNGSSSARSAYLRSENETAQPSSGDLGSVSVPANDENELTFTLGETAFKQFYVYVSDPLQFHEFIVTLEGSATYSDYMTTCCTQYNVNIADGIENGSVSADPTAACEGTTVTLTATPDPSYHFDAWSVVDAESNAVTVTDNQFTMPATAVTVSATFAHDECADLATPANIVADVEITAAMLEWSDVEHADKYLVYIYDNEDNEIEHATVTEAAYIVDATLSAATTYKYSIQAQSNTPADYCDSPLKQGTFTTEDYPAATLTLSENGTEHDFGTNLHVNDVIQLPQASGEECAGKVLVGWSTNAECAEAPEYAKGADFTLSAASQKLYAVYAKETAGAKEYVKTAFANIASGSVVVVTEKVGDDIYAASNNNGTSAAPSVIAVTETNDKLTAGVTADALWTLTKDGNNFSLAVGDNKMYCTATNNGVRVGTNTNNVFSINENYLYNNATTRYLGVYSDSGTPKDFRCYTSINANIKDQTLAFYVENSQVSYSNYSTSCVAPLATPTFSVNAEEGPFATAQSIELNAAEGTIYYTLDGSTPDAESTEYTEAIVLNKCGTTTIKAIAISTDNESAVVEAAYTIAIPIPTNSQANPYTPAIAREVIDGGCYDGETIIYVKGVVKTSSGLNTTYLNYDNVAVVAAETTSPEFTFYRLQKTAEDKFATTDPAIAEGDTIIAAGKLLKHTSGTYELAQGCYLVERKEFKEEKQAIVSSLEAPLSVAQAIYYVDNGVTYDLSQEVYVKAVANAAPNNYGTFTGHDADVENAFQFYDADLNNFTIGANDTVIVKGLIKLVNSNYRMEPGVVQSVKAYVEPVIAVTGVELSQTEASIMVDVNTVTLTATITPASASNKNVVWTISEGSEFASVDENGVVTGIKEGIAKVRATAEADENIYAECTVTVSVDSRKVAVSDANGFTAISGDLTPADIKFAAYKGGASNAPATNNNEHQLRLYKYATGENYGGYLTLKPIIGYKIDQVQITVGDNCKVDYSINNAAIPTNANEGISVSTSSPLMTEAGLNADSIRIANIDGSNQFRIVSIKVWYTGEALPVHHYILGGTYATVFEQYGEFNYEGLTVTAAYDAGETITEAVVGFTVEADLSTAGNKKAEVMLNSVKIAEYDITVTESPKQNPALAYTPIEETITLGDTWSAPVFSNPLNVEGITFSTSNNKVAKVTSAGVITLEGGCGTAVITASFEATEAYVASEATYTITVNEPAENLAGKWEIVKEVLPGMRIIIANEAAKTMGAQNSNNRAAVASTVDGDGILTPANGTKTFLVVETETEGQYALRALNGNYIYAASNSSNNLKEQTTINGNAMWSFSFAEGGAATIQANGTNSHNLVRYNSQSDIFSCYASGQSDVYVYAWKPYTRTVSGNYGTICLPNGGVLTNGALYEIAYYGETSKKIFFDEVEGGVMVAGKPYIFKPNDGETTLRVVYTDAANVPEAGHKNGLYGHYDLNNPDEGAEAARKFLTNGDYFLRNNEYWLVDQENRVYVDNYRAYIKLNQINQSEPSLVPGRRRIALNVNNEQVATGIDALNASDAPVKVLIDGQLFIIRGEKMFDAKGQLVK